MKERINVNGIDIDISSGNSMSICIKSNILKKADELIASYSYTYTVPMTKTNINVFGHLMVLGTTPKVRQYLNAEYYRDEYLIFRGKVCVTDCNADTISLRFIFGVNDAIFKIKEDGKNLCDLWNGVGNVYEPNYFIEDLQNYKVETPCNAVNCLPYPFEYRKPADFFMNQINVGFNSFNNEAITPSMNIGALLERIKDVYGLVLDDGLTNKENYWIICNKKRRKDRMNLVMTETNHQFGQITEHYEDVDGSYFGGIDGMDMGHRATFSYTYEQPTNIYPFVDVKRKYKINKIHYEASGFNTSSGKCYYIPNYDKDKEGFETRNIFEWHSSSDVVEGEYYPKDDSMKYEYDAGTYPVLWFSSSTTDIRISTLKITFFLQLDDEGNGWLNIFDCLPEISISSFISQYLFGCLAKFPVNSLKNTNVIKCVDIETIANTTAYDWSEKLMVKDMKVYHTIASLAKNNYLKTKERAETSPSSTNLPTQDDTIDTEEDFFVSDFGKYYPPHYHLTDNYTTAIENTPDFVYVDRFAAVSYDGAQYAALQNLNLEWAKDGNQIFRKMKEIFLHPLRLECQLNLTTSDLAQLDLTRPVYFTQFGQYFFIDTLTVGSDSTKAVLIKL